MNARGLTTDVLLGVVPIALAVAVWQAISSFGYAPVTLLPPPGLVFARLAQQLLTSSSYQQAIAVTLFRLFAGFSIAVVLGVGVGLAAAASPAVNAVVRPIVRVLAPLPKVALYPALLLLLGFGHESKITLVAADALFPILLSTYFGASMVEQKLHPVKHNDGSWRVAEADRCVNTTIALGRVSGATLRRNSVIPCYGGLSRKPQALRPICRCGPTP